jgi:hypothetical protein
MSPENNLFYRLFSSNQFRTYQKNVFIFCKHCIVNDSKDDSTKHAPTKKCTLYVWSVIPNRGAAAQESALRIGQGWYQIFNFPAFFNLGCNQYFFQTSRVPWTQKGWKTLSLKFFSPLMFRCLCFKTPSQNKGKKT